MADRSPRDEELVTRVREALESLGRGDTSAVSALVADDLEYDIPGAHQFAGVRTGKEAFLTLVAGLLDGFENRTIDYDFHRAMVSGNTVIVTFRGTGTTVTGKPYRNEYCTLWDFGDDAEVIRITEFFDSHHVVSTVLV